MEDANETAQGSWASMDDRPTNRQRMTVQQAVGRLFDLLAPERPPARRPEVVPSVQRLRQPRGCILQAPLCAVSVSWFAGASTDPALGELQLITWDGVVARPGAARREGSAGAQIVAQEVLLPVETGRDTWVWRAADGTTYDAAALAARCEALLEAQATSA